ncbi:hypothetical protein [Actinopolymorpha pittospori]|uniref:Uncharacterized protein n=1 Tax=Actinopolymorpha pittospori TaxID=648752 RepID=A0A927NBU0_9ACTN|nr:hypothetical protein [Actinopolymorpha pittospori]MBE1612642.1 hypothetical protein [Actinopolymorpha pittospori]
MHGADLNWLAPWSGQTPLDAARRQRHQEARHLAAQPINDPGGVAGELPPRERSAWTHYAFMQFDLPLAEPLALLDDEEDHALEYEASRSSADEIDAKMRSEVLRLLD